MRARGSVEAEEAELRCALDGAVSRCFGMLARTVQKNLAVLSVAFLRVLAAARSGHGRLSLAALSRMLPTEGPPTPERNDCIDFFPITGSILEGAPMGWSR